jgi:flagellar hook-associated protein FlgK
MQVSLTQQSVTANNIANVQTRGYSQLNAQQASVQPMGVRVTAITPTPNPNPNVSGTDLAQQMANLASNKSDLAANAKVFKVQNQMLGDVIDLIA